MQIGDAARTLLRTALVREIAPHDQMFKVGGDAHYFGVGLSALWVINSCLVQRSAFAEPARDILDFGAGCGRVTRFLRAAYPDAKISVHDVRAADAAWCADTLGCTVVGRHIPARSFDLIWLGSVFSHLGERAATDLFTRLTASLRPYGVLAFSTHGRYSAARLRAIDWAATVNEAASYGLDRTRVENLVSDFDQGRYAYVDYPGVTDYGISVVQPGWYLNQLERLKSSLVFAQERAYDDHQDAFGFIRREIAAPRHKAFIS